MPEAMNKTRGLSTIQLAIVLTVLATLAGIFIGQRAEISSLKLKVARTEATYNTYVAKAESNAREAAVVTARRQAELQETAEKARSDRDQKVLLAHAERDAALDRLHNRPSRPAPGVSQPRADAGGAEVKACTGAELYREDGIAFIGIAADAEQLRADYNELFTVYERARTQTEKVGQ